MDEIEVMRKIENNTLNNLEEMSNYEKLLIKICTDFKIDNYEEVIKNYTKK